jgi:hypothetical protein
MDKRLHAVIRERTHGSHWIFQGLYCFLIASLVFHREWLLSTLHTDNVVCASPFLSETIPFEQYVMTRFPWNQISDIPEITGLPVDVNYLARIQELQMEFAELKQVVLADNAWLEQSIVEQIRASLDRGSVGGEGYSLGK